jgi:hypothetical protein
MTQSNPGKKPDFVLKHDVRDSDGKTVRSIRVGAMWAPDGNRPGRIVIEYTPVSWDGRYTVWPYELKQDEVGA